MTEDNKQANAADEILRAEACIGEAKALRAAGFPYGATTRAYYAIFHAARALLVSAGIEVRTHHGVARMFGEHFVKSGKVAPEYGRLLAHLQRDREDADYVIGAVFTDREAESAIADAERFLGGARDALAASST